MLLRAERWLVVLLVGLFFSAQAQGEPLWRMLTPQKKVDAQVGSDYTLTETAGPWLVMAATFSGEKAEEQAQELVMELRSHYNLPAYLHAMTFDYSGGDKRLGRGIDQYGASSRKRYQTDRTEEIAVLVGDFPAIDDERATAALDKIKLLRPEALSGDLRETSQTLAQEREFFARVQGSRGAPPMHKAFLTRNPKLPAEYFQPKGVDPFVSKMNQGVEYSLLDCRGKYTVKIATFRGKAELQGAFSSGSKSRHRKKVQEVDPLVEAAENAHSLVTFLRTKGWPAFEFHDRTESIVTVGSFAKVTEDSAAGSRPVRDVTIMLRTFGAAYKTPAALHVNQNVPMEDSMRAEHVKQKFSNLFSNEHGQIAQGLQPKYIEPMPGKFIPLDVHPHVMEVPRRSVTSAYAWGK